MTNKIRNKDENPDPLTGAPGAHPVGTGVGALAGGAAAGAAAGTVAGPVGTAAGAIVGAIAGGLAGKAAAEKIDPTAEEAYWKENFRRQPGYEQGRSYEDYAPFHRVAREGRARFGNRPFEEVEAELQLIYIEIRGDNPLTWEQGRHQVRAAWNRLDELFPDSD
jgi:hypothetical protein